MNSIKINEVILKTLSIREKTNKTVHSCYTLIQDKKVNQWLLIILVLSASALQAQDINIMDRPIMLKFTSLDGRKVDIENLKGKVILIDCWATWCGPCLREIPHIKALLQKYQNRGFEVIGISLDNAASKDRVLQIIKSNSIEWPQRFEGKGFNDDSFVKQFEIRSLPTGYLINKEGNIIDTNAKGDRLESLIKKSLGL